MSEELIDDSILNADGSNGSNVGEGGGGSNIDLNEDQIAELLGDNSADTVEENITTIITGESQEEIREAVLTDFEAESSEAALEEGRAEDLQIPVVEIDQDVLLANVSSQNMDEGYDENDVIIDDEVEEIHQNIEDFVEEEGLSEEVLIDDGEVAARQENTLLGQEMEEIFEHDDDVIPMEADDIEIISDVNRKRAGGDKSAPSPVPKRQRRVQTCFELRQQWIEMVSRLYGSWDAQISVSNLQFIKNLSIANQRRLIDVHIQNENILKTEIRSLREQLLQERRAHTATRVALKTLTEDANVMRKQLGKLSDMITQPTTAKLLDAFFPRTQTDHDTDNTPPRSHPNVLATAQQACRSAYHVPRTTPSQSRPLPQKQIYSTLERVQSLTSNRQYAKSYINMAQRASTHVPKKQSSAPQSAPLSHQPSSLPKAQDSYTEHQETFQGSNEILNCFLNFKSLSDITPCLQEENPSKLLQESSSSRNEINSSLVEVQPSTLTKPHLSPNIPRSLQDVQTLIDFMEWFPTDRELLPELMRIGVIMRSRQCTNCGKEMKISFKKGVYQWRCRERNRDCSCKSVKSDSWFQNQGVSLGRSVRFLISWSIGMSGPDMHRELNMSSATIGEWKNMCRHLCLRVCRKLPMIGGLDTVVEIGLTFRQPKKTVGEEAAKEPICILGAIERESRKCFATIVPNQTTHCLIAILTQAVRQDSIVVTDELTALDDMDIHFRRHESVCHSRNYQGKSSDGLAVDTNTISSFWRAMGNGTTEELFPSYIAEFVSREWYGIDLWKRLLEEIQIV